MGGVYGAEILCMAPLGRSEPSFRDKYGQPIINAPQRGKNRRREAMGLTNPMPAPTISANSNVIAKRLSGGKILA